MSNDPLTEQLKMRSILSYRCLHLFNEHGKPRVLLRQQRTITDAKGTKRTFLHWEWGDLASAFFSDDMRKKFTDAWNDYLSWTAANK